MAEYQVGERVAEMKYGRSVLAMMFSAALVPVSNAAAMEPLSPTEIYDSKIRSVVFIEVQDGDDLRRGSGVLVSKEYRLVVTNHHVTQSSGLVTVAFSAFGVNGLPILEPSFYRNNRRALQRMGYVTKGHVVASDEQADLAVIEVSGVPVTSIAMPLGHELQLSEMAPRSPVHIFGNPGNNKRLWRWEPGWYMGLSKGMLKLAASVHPGTSGGPVVDDQSGLMIGIVTRADYKGRNTVALAVTTEAVLRLMGTLKKYHVFSVLNRFPGNVSVQFRWAQADDWQTVDIQQGSWLAARRPISIAPADGFPQIRFDVVANDDKVTPVIYGLESHPFFFGIGAAPPERESSAKYELTYANPNVILRKSED